MCIHIYVYIHTYIHTYIHRYICMLFICLRLDICIYTYMYKCRDINIYIYTYTHHDGAFMEGPYVGSNRSPSAARGTVALRGCSAETAASGSWALGTANGDSNDSDDGYGTTATATTTSSTATAAMIRTGSDGGSHSCNR